ncbi:MAG: hydroxymethylbilane synthase, partial [Acidobacteria bacterium]|nr:hydroxymethylbilane synthase [Acidobacteriota bacterium]
EEICPAAGQGALGIEVRKRDVEVCAALAGLEDPIARAETTCERALLHGLGGGCQVPIGASATWHNNRLRLEAVLADPAATLVLRECVTGTDPVGVGSTAAENLLRRGGQTILAQVHARPTSVPEQP